MMLPPERMAPLKACRLGIDTHHEPTLYLPAHSHVCRSEGFDSLSRVLVTTHQGRHLITSLNIITSDLLGDDEVGFSDSAWERLQLASQDPIWLSHPKPVQSLSHVRAKVYGHELDDLQFQSIINDIVDGRYAEVHLAAFITACGDDSLSDREITSLTQAMVKSGSTLDWQLPLVVDKHCVGGLPGNRTTPIVVSILTACGLTVPKTSSRAITSPAGTADTMETLTDVSLTLEQMRDVVSREGGCLAWGGAMRLSPADDMLIQVERALDIDSEGQLIASVLSKKIAAGATHVLIDIPVGPTAKVRSRDAGERLAESFRAVAANLGLTLEILFTDGSQPVGRGIGPALEAHDLLAVLQRMPNAPQDLRTRAAQVAGAMLAMVRDISAEEGTHLAEETLDSGAAWDKFQAICAAQGGLRMPPVASYRYALVAEHAGTVSRIDNRLLAKIAKLAGAPADPAAGVEICVKLGDQVACQDILLMIHAENAGELNYAVEYLNDHTQVIELDRTTQEEQELAC
ncbi:thymidine phosphorylase family protein [Marinobacterium weihaiense]|uniref:Putative thymidine phosphorylase n=1 Tax=Marinobacterium weihaiense TaxID=2851016 RepID=A0ABS6MA25_9GAMM|nr:thymidine phosphorylase family protein [Marinobacterium weihaiense]MBV0933138.1 thymidine phosphorylase family protein [Marinobacterium weihaiense]